MKALALTSLTWAVFCSHSALTAEPGSAFSYQGHLQTKKHSADGVFDFRVTLHDSETGGNLVADPVERLQVPVTEGDFRLLLDFGPEALIPPPRWLELAVRDTKHDRGYTVLTPRQPLTPVPYAILAARAASVTEGAIDSSALANRSVTADKFHVTTPPLSGQVLSYGGNGLVWTNMAGGAVYAWSLEGNVGTVAGRHFLGTTDNQPLEIRVNNQRALLLSAAPLIMPNITLGASNNFISPAVAGSSIGGGLSNTITGNASVIAGGRANTLLQDFGTIGGGLRNRNLGGVSTIAGGADNLTASSSSTVGGGRQNICDASDATIAGGSFNTASGVASAIGGGTGNRTSALWGTIAGGSSNSNSANVGTIAGGLRNVVTQTLGTVSGGATNSATNVCATVPGGAANVAGGAFSLAAGHRAKSVHNGAFVWADSTSMDFISTASNQFLIRASGGVGIGTQTPSAQLHVAGSIVADGTIQGSSDRHVKTNFNTVNAHEILKRLVDVPVHTWSYTNDAGVRHIGPTAQDFQAAFGVGRDDKLISMVDADGVAMAAIQGLYEIIKEQQAHIAALREEITGMRTARSSR